MQCIIIIRGYYSTLILLASFFDLIIKLTMKNRLISILLAYKLYNKIYIFNPKILNYLKFKLIVIFLLLIYLIFFILFLYFSYKSYLYAVQELSHRQANRSFNDLAFLTSELPLV